MWMTQIDHTRIYNMWPYYFYILHAHESPENFGHILKIIITDREVFFMLNKSNLLNYSCSMVSNALHFRHHILAQTHGFFHMMFVQISCRHQIAIFCTSVRYNMSILVEWKHRLHLYFLQRKQTSSVRDWVHALGPTIHMAHSHFTFLDWYKLQHERSIGFFQTNLQLSIR